MNIRCMVALFPKDSDPDHRGKADHSDQNAGVQEAVCIKVRDKHNRCQRRGHRAAHAGEGHDRTALLDILRHGGIQRIDWRIADGIGAVPNQIGDDRKCNTQPHIHILIENKQQDRTDRN